MFDTVLGLPAHPLIVHAAVVFTPLLVALVIAYSVVPPWRKWLAWAVVVFAVLAPLALWAARLSGEKFLEHQAVNALPDRLAKLQEHQNFGELTAWYGTALGVLALLLVWACSSAAGKPASAGSRIITVGLIVLSLAAAVLTAYYVFKTGDTGARNVWGS